jgi:phage shock protein E
MKQILFSVFLLVSITCIGQTKIDATTVQSLKFDATVQIVDLRTQAELDKTGKIEGAVNINYSAPDFEAQITKLDKEKPIVVYCAAGGRSGKTAALLQKNGFKTIYDYNGGMADWVAKGLKTDK